MKADLQQLIPFQRNLDLDLDLDQYVANHPFTGIGAMAGGAQFAGILGSWLLPEPI